MAEMNETSLAFLSRAKAVKALAQTGGTEGERQAASAALARLAEPAQKIAADLSSEARTTFRNELRQISPLLVKERVSNSFRVGMWAFNERTGRAAEVLERWGARTSGEEIFFVDGEGAPTSRAWYQHDMRPATAVEVQIEQSKRAGEREAREKEFALWRAVRDAEMEKERLRQSVRGDCRIYALASYTTRSRSRGLCGTAWDGKRFVLFRVVHRRITSTREFGNRASATRAFNKLIERGYRTKDSSEEKYDWLYPLLQTKAARTAAS